MVCNLQLESRLRSCTSLMRVGSSTWTDHHGLLTVSEPCVQDPYLSWLINVLLYTPLKAITGSCDWSKGDQWTAGFSNAKFVVKSPKIHNIRIVMSVSWGYINNIIQNTYLLVGSTVVRDFFSCEFHFTHPLFARI